MKKIISVLAIITIILLVTINSYAEGETTTNIEINLKGQTSITKDTKTVELTLSLEKFIGVAENLVLGYETTLTYDTNMFESVTVEGVNGWSSSYEPTTKILIGDVATAKSNTDITKITLKLKDGIKPGSTGKVKINNLLLSDGDNDFTFSKEVTIKMEEEKAPANNTNTNNSNTNTAVNNNTSSTNGINTNKTTTAATTKLPAAGIKDLFIIAIVVILITGVISLIRYKSIKLK